MVYFNQEPYDIRCEWGLAGVQLLAPISDAVIIVDVFSFTTSVDIAVSRGAQVYPFAWKDERAAEFANSMQAVLAVASRNDPHGFSLAPTSMLRLPRGAKVVLPSPNGATLSLATGSAPTLAGCLRNAPAVAAAAASIGPRVSVIPSGERWPDQSLRPGLEDWIGAGAVIHHLPGTRSPEAEAAEAAFLNARDRLEEVLRGCSSGREAAARGTPEDVRLAAALAVSPAVPRLVDGAYQDASMLR